MLPADVEKMAGRPGLSPKGVNQFVLSLEMYSVYLDSIWLGDGDHQERVDDIREIVEAEFPEDQDLEQWQIDTIWWAIFEDSRYCHGVSDGAEEPVSRLDGIVADLGRRVVSIRVDVPYAQLSPSAGQPSSPGVSLGGTGGDPATGRAKKPRTTSQDTQQPPPTTPPKPGSHGQM